MTEEQDKIADLELHVEDLVKQVDARDAELRELGRNREFRRRAAEVMYSTAGMPGITTKLTIQQVKDGEIVEHDLYLHRTYFEGKLNFIDITCGGSIDYSVRRLITLVCDHVRRELRHGLLDEEQLVLGWRATFEGTNSFEPQGTCPQLPGGYMGQLVGSPLDAVARWMSMTGVVIPKEEK